MMLRQEIVEKLAAIEHQRWAEWQRYVHASCVWVPDGEHENARALVIPAPLVARWERQIAMPYEMLSESEKSSDREQVARYWSVVVDVVAEWLEQASCDDFTQDYPAQIWREEMS